MSIKLGKYSFNGSIESTDRLNNKSGVYVIVCKVDSEYFIIDVGESSKIMTKKIVGKKTAMDY